MTETKTETEIESTEGDVISKEQLPTEEELKQQEVGKFSDDKRKIDVVPEEDVKEVKESVSEVHSQPTPVPGESQREHALRLEIERLRTKLRGDNLKEVVNTTVTKQTTDPYKDLREKGYSDDEIKQMEVAVDLIAKNKGYIRADDSYKQSIQDTIDSFIDEHPEYKPVNDKDDLRWTQFQSILQNGIYNLSNKTPRQLKAIFSKVDEDVKKEMGESITVRNKNQIAAQQHKINVASHSGGTKTIPKLESKVDPTQPIGGVVFKGFDAEDFKV